MDRLIEKRNALLRDAEETRKLLFKIESQIELLGELIGEKGSTHRREEPLAGGDAAPRQNKSGFKTTNPEIHTAILNAVKDNPGKTLPEIVDIAVEVLGQDPDDKDQRTRVYNIGHGLVRRKQIHRDKPTKKLYPSDLFDPSIESERERTT